MNGNFITDIKIDKVRHLENLEVKLSKDERKHLILTGKNGSGKTSVLEAIKRFLESVQDGNLLNLDYYPSKINKLEIELETLRKVDDNRYEAFELERDIKRLNEELIYHKGELSINLNSTKDIIKLYNKGKFILAHYSSSRESKVRIPKGVEKIYLKKNYNIDENPSLDFLQYLVDIKTQQSFATNEGDKEVADRINAWFENFEYALKDIFEDKSLKLKFNYRNYDFKIIQDGREPFGFDVLSDGYSSILNIVMDLILRMERQKGYYSENEYRQYIYDVEGIVLIDEVETHLHIELQKKIMPFLINIFPKIQFIVSTHSPFVLSSVDNAVVYDLQNKIQVEDLSKYSYEGIVESYFDIDQYSYEIKNRIERYEHLVNIKNKTEDEEDEMFELRRYLKGISPDLSPELVYKFREIELKRRGGVSD